MKVCLKKYGTDATGTTYTKEVLQDAVNNLDNELLGTLIPSVPVDLTDVAFTVHNITVEEDGLYGEIRILNTPKGYTLTDTISEETKFGINGIGLVQHDGIITDYSLASVSVLQNSKD